MTGPAAPRGPWSLRELHRDLRDGRTTPADALARSRAAVADTESEVHAWVARDPEPEPRATGPLGGVPLGVKDIIDVAGFPTRCGTSLREHAAPAGTDAAIVTAWRRAGAIPVGKTVTTEFAYFSPGPTRNPRALGHTPGGSSSGSAAAVASGHVPLALGTQTAASVTRPASYCGVASLVLTHGRIPMTGTAGLSPSFDSHGLYTAGVTDLALAWSALTGEADPGATAPRPPRLLLWTAKSLGVVEDGMREAVDAAARRLADAGAVVDAFPEEGLVAEAVAAQKIVMAYEAARERAAELAVASRLSEQLATLLRSGEAMAPAEYDAARSRLAEIGSALTDLSASYDAVVGPAAPGPAPVGLSATGDPILSRPWQALGLPVVTVPGTADAAGLPLGVQLVGRACGEHALLTAGCWTESALRGRE
ncbi:amidase [Prauserella halophila]|uniref:amidase n=1 Tax=Prauserella halophila TaxID=185641 RepID=UPI0020A29DF2|nr:amidase [Prauserella halophila]MCP2238061.1 Asp-tRNAAsn/Glu-tRNAGln amidotransferase A subunit [Prauserella halophila]